MVAHTFNPALRTQRQVNVCEIEVSLVHTANVRTGCKATEKNPVSKNKQKNLKMDADVIEQSLGREVGIF